MPKATRSGKSDANGFGDIVVTRDEGRFALKLCVPGHHQKLCFLKLPSTGITVPVM